MLNILILTQSPFSKRDYDRFGIELLSQYFQVHVLDCSPWVSPDLCNKDSCVVYQHQCVRSIADFDSLRRCINSSDRYIAIDYLGNCPKSRQIRTYLKSRGIPRAIVHSGLLPSSNDSWLGMIRRLITSSAIHSFREKIYRKISQKVFPDPVPEIVLLSGAAGLNDQKVSEIRHKIWAHSLDYDIYLKNGIHASQATEPYAVFLDEDMVYHVDYSHLQIRPPATEEAYYSAMNKFLQNLERAIGMPVVIAAHPRARYDLRPQLWNGRTTISDKTASLVRDASLVICHQSTSVSFAVLWRRSLVFLTTNEINASFIGPKIALLSSLLRAPLVNVDEVSYTLHAPPQVSEEAYAKYVQEYIKKPETPDLQSWQIFSDYVKREFQ